MSKDVRPRPRRSPGDGWLLIGLIGMGASVPTLQFDWFLVSVLVLAYWVYGMVRWPGR